MVPVPKGQALRRWRASPRAALLGVVLIIASDPGGPWTVGSAQRGSAGTLRAGTADDQSLGGTEGSAAFRESGQVSSVGQRAGGPGRVAAGHLGDRLPEAFPGRGAGEGPTPEVRAQPPLR